MFILHVIFSAVCFYILQQLFFKIVKWNRRRKIINKIQGPKTLPIIGNWLDFRGDRKTVFKTLRYFVGQYLNFGLVRIWLLNYPMVFVFSPEEAEVILTSTVHLTKGIIYRPLLPWLGTGLLTSTGQKWHHRRKILQPAFHSKILQGFLKVFSKESKNLSEKLRNHANKELDIIPIISKFTLNSICETFMGTTLESLDAVEKYYNSILEMGEICIRRIVDAWMLSDILYSITPLKRHQQKILNYVHKFSSDIITRRKNGFKEFMERDGSNLGSYSERKRLAMLDILLSAQNETGIIDDEGIREEVDTFIFEGYDTTALSLIYTTMLLANNRIQQDKIYEEIISVFRNDEEELTISKLDELKYMEMCIKESLRLYPSVPLISRCPNGDIETKSGHIIPKDCICFVSIFEIHRRGDIYPNPEIFDPYRFLPENIAKRHPSSYIPFSAGPRNCIGQRFAILELKCALLEILRNFILVPIDTPETVEISLDIVLRPTKPIKVKFIPRE